MKIELIQQLAEQLSLQRYSSIQRLPSPSRRTFISITRELLTAPSRRASIMTPHRLFEPSPFAERDYARFERQHPGVFLLFTAFFLNREVGRDRLVQYVGEPLISDLEQAVLLKTAHGRARATIRMVPYRDLMLVTDPWDRGIDGFAYLGKDSIDMAEFLRRYLEGRSFTRGLDLCTGGGIHALLLADRCEQVTAVDINPRALEYSRCNSLINRKANVSFLCSDLTSEVKGRFDIVVSNPPLRFLPGDQRQLNRDGFGGALGIELTKKILQALKLLLADDGMAVVGSVAPLVNGTNVLLHDINSIFSEEPFDVELVLTDLTSSEEHRELHERYRISSLLPCYIVVKRSQRSGVTVTDRIAYRPAKQAAIRVRQFTGRWRQTEKQSVGAFSQEPARH